MDESWRWFHLTTHTYGAWLYGESRGFRTRHHREHIEGDYKNPPPKGKYDKQKARSEALLTQEPVTLSAEWQQIVGEALRDKLIKLGAQVLCVSMSSTHAHVLAKIPPGAIPRKWLGQAKKHASFVCKEQGWDRKLWAVRCKVTPIKDRKHQLNAFGYILGHVNEGAWIWDFRRQDPGTAVPGLSSNNNPESPGTAVPGPPPENQQP